jgi:hypothetical protein
MTQILEIQVLPINYDQHWPQEMSNPKADKNWGWCAPWCKITTGQVFKSTEAIMYFTEWHFYGKKFRAR